MTGADDSEGQVGRCIVMRRYKMRLVLKLGFNPCRAWTVFTLLNLEQPQLVSIGSDGRQGRYWLHQLKGRMLSAKRSNLGNTGEKAGVRVASGRARMAGVSSALWHF